MALYICIHVFVDILIYICHCCCFSMLQGLLDFDGFYLESDPCLVCNNPEVNYSVCTFLSFFICHKYNYLYVHDFGDE